MATASEFSEWVFLHNHPNWRRHASQTRGRKVDLRMGHYWHKMIAEDTLWRHIGFKTSEETWDLVFSSEEADDKRVFLASGLLVLKSPLRCVPDIVLRGRSSGRFLIIERKIHRLKQGKPFNPASWQNVRAQLWCYAQIDEWKAACPYLVSEVWPLSSGSSSPILPSIAAWAADEIDVEIAKLFHEWSTTYSFRRMHLKDCVFE